MSKMETLKDLLIEGEISKQDLRDIASEVFDGGDISAGPEGYFVALPEFGHLDDRAQSYIIKVLLESTVQNILFRDSVEDEAAESEDDGVADPFPVADTD